MLNLRKQVSLVLPLISIVSMFAFNFAVAAVDIPVAPFQPDANSVKGTITNQMQQAATPAYGATAKDPRLVVMEVIKIALSLFGTIFIGLFIMSSYWYVTAQGDEAKIESAISTIKAAIIGFIIVLAAYSITYFVGARVLQVTSDQPAGPEKPYQTQACRDSFWACF